MFYGAAPKVILANQSAAWLRKLHEARAGEIETAGLGHDWSSFRRKLSEIRRNGFYVSHGELEADISAVAAPIRAGSADAHSALALVTTLRLLDLCRLAVRLAQRRCPPPLPKGPGGRPRIYSEESLLLIALLRTLWRLSYEDMRDWLRAWPDLALACGLPRDRALCRVLLVTRPGETPVNELVETAFNREDQVGGSLGRRAAVGERRGGEGGERERGGVARVRERLVTPGAAARAAAAVAALLGEGE